ncbi:AGE family epimerase/isomerase [Dyadobacter subterraneus]|uniref:AGE family epimerase/isomerase n=1 Tax=Dyadobacter subterraneus TaxID=2773304 RepID=A0ABR9WE71_9BACT|nr:AGE family epimerase/isomerase [Dyadobacter subterraneus]MBE9463790.1 AGE family epimerase/isomerase [Dyadobacter subterraneus]
MEQNSIQFEKYLTLYRSTLLDDVIPFWLDHSADAEFGGYFTCLDRIGQVFDTDKFVWLQCRQVWCFSMLYNKVEQKQQWLDFALQGAEFLEKHGSDSEGNWYFSLDRKGAPLTQPHNIFSDCFASMAFGQLYKATKNERHAKIAVDTFHNILAKKENPKGQYDKSFPGTRPLKGFALPMILCNLVLEIEHLLPADLVESTIQNGIETILGKFYRPDLGIILENVTPDGAFSDSFEGRLVNPGHGIEAMWFLMDLAERAKDKALAQKAMEITLNILEYGWDKKHGGVFYFMDAKGLPPQQLEWDQKLWWVHVETLISLLKGYQHTGDHRCWDWFEKVHQYTWQHFADPEFGEWYGYLNRQGEVLLPLKGGKWKGCFHVPRGLYQCWKALEVIMEKKSEIQYQ